MEAIIKTNDKKTFKSILRFLRDLGIEIISKEERVISQKAKSLQEEKFFEAAGIWEGRDISKEKLRKMAWRKG
ncbi:MAG: hypothetical protein AABZ32_10220 [Bacteroidota bacterium]